MPYIYHNKQTEVYALFGNLKTLSNKTGIPYDTLKSQFTRLKNIVYKRDNFVITKAEVSK